MAVEPVRLKHLVRLINEDAPPGSPYVGLEHVESWTGKYTVTDSTDGTARAFRPGDVLFGKLRPYLAKAILVRQAGGCSSELLVLRPGPRLNSGFLGYVVLEQGFVRAVDGSTFGAKMPRANWDFIGDQRIPLPPLHTQKAIADFLDRKTDDIDDLIAKKQRLLDLLAEKRAALINRAVTKGLDPTVPMKDSGISWLGEIPSHWEVKRLKHLRSGSFSYGANEPATASERNDPRYIRITDLRQDGGLHEDTFRSLPLDKARSYILSEGDILFARSGATVGKAVRYRTEWGRCCYAGYLIKMRPRLGRVLPEFVELFTQSPAYRTQVSLACIQATIQNVSAERYGEFVVPLPPLDEQKVLVQGIGTVVDESSRIAEATTEVVQRLQEYRQALITAAVTGQLDISKEAV